MKERFTILDLRAVVNELKNSITGKFITNVYSTTQKLFYLKLNSKDILLIESGVRMHLTDKYDVEIKHFCKKLRETIKNCRINDIYQYGWDRIVILDLGRFYLVLEFFSQGNVLVVDKENTIVEVLRQIDNLNMKKGEKYPWNPVEIKYDIDSITETNIYDALPFEKQVVDQLKSKILENGGFGDKKLAKNVIDNFIKKLEEVSGYGQITYKNSKFDSIFPIPVTKSTAKIKTLTGEKEKVCNAIEDLNLKQGEDEKPKENVHKIPILNHSQILEQTSNIKKFEGLEFDSFNQTCNFYFSGKVKAKKAKPSKDTKIDRIKSSQASYIKQLDLQVENITERIDDIENERSFVEEIIKIFNSVYQEKLNWDTFEHFYQEERQKGNPYASAIISYDLKAKRCLVKINENVIEIDLKLNASKNIEAFYKSKKKLENKKEKTIEAMDTIHEKMKFNDQKKENKITTSDRTAYWFEKFHYFISSNRNLILGGKNAQQNEILVKKHLEDNDLCFHCDVHGASSIIVKPSNGIIDESCLKEASIMALCMSKCWEDTIIKEVFWVNADQVSKTPVSGEYLSKGGFMIKGKKNFLYPYRLEYGIAIVFKLVEANDLLDFVKEAEDRDILHAVVINGPWDTLKAYKFSMRICPGTDKKQRIARTVSSEFIKMADNKNEKSAIEKIGLQEYINVISGKSRLAKK